MRSYSKKSVQVFFGVVVVLSALVEGGIIFMGDLQVLYLVLMWLPALAALAANIIRLKEAGQRITPKTLVGWGNFHKCKVRYLLLACLLPLVYLLVPYLVYWATHPETFAYRGVALPVILKDCLPITVLGVFLSLLTAIGEEIGWRGFMVPALYETVGLNWMLVISSLFWCGWHLPILAFGDYMSGTPAWYKLPAFVLCIFPVGVMAGLLTVKSRSLWPAAFLHAAHNNYDQTVFGVITVGGADRMYFVSETGIVTILCAWILAAGMYLWVKKTENKS